MPGRTITIFSGTQGLGTSHAGSVLERPLLLEAVAQRVGAGEPNFQSLFRISGIAHDHADRVTSIGEIEHVDTQRFAVP